MDKTDTIPHKRIRALAALMFVIGAVFVVRLFYVQVIKHDYYEAEALKEHTAKFAIPASRGEIYAKDGEGKIAPLVLNEPSYTVYADPRYVKDESKVAEVLRKIAGGNLVEGFEDSLKNKDKQYVVLAKLLNKQQADLLKKESLGGVGLQESEKRTYLEGTLAAQILGFVNGEGQGQYGLEQGYNERLSGKAGQLKAITDVNGIPISVGDDNVQTPAQNGEDVVLSIDRNIQAYVERALKSGLDKVHATKGSAIVVNPNNGQIMAMASLPTFNPGEYQKVTDYNAFQNPAVSDPYEPGSVTKTFTVAMGLNEGVIHPDTTYVNTGSTKVADATIKNLGSELLGDVKMLDALRYSYNTGMVHILRLLGDGDINDQAKNKFYQYLTDHFLLGRRTGIPLAGEAAGQVISPNDEQGGPVRYANMTFGQGMTMTMLQAASAFSALVNGGTYYSPQIISGTLNDKNEVVAKQPDVKKTGVISAEASDKLRAMTHEIRAGSLGKFDKPGYTTGGKTGTAQVYDAETGKYSKTQTVGGYLGYGGQNRPEYVIMIRVDDSDLGDFAGTQGAAPIFTDISNWLLDYLKIKPRG